MWSPSRNRRTEGAEFRSEHGWHHESRRFRPVAGDESAFLRPTPASESLRRPVGADAPGRPLLPLWGNSPSAHIGPPCARLARPPRYLFDTCFLVMPPAGPFLCGQKGAKEPAGKGGFRFPPFPAPIPLKTTKEGASGPPSLESPPSCPTDSAPAAGAYAVTPPPHRPGWGGRGDGAETQGAGLVPARSRQTWEGGEIQ